LEFSALPKDEPVKKIPGTECDKETEKADGRKRTGYNVGGRGEGYYRYQRRKAVKQK
jgi:hypothetical protein